MPNYNTEEPEFDFFSELHKSLDDNNDDDENTCLITGLPLIANFFEFPCGHKFNYEALCKEIYKQKHIFKTYDIFSLNKKEQQKYKELKIDYFIKCPYCRSAYFDILPYYDELKIDKRYGINTLDKAYDVLSNNHSYLTKSHFIYSGVEFKLGFGNCCYIYKSGYNCTIKHLSPVGETPNISYFCNYHYKSGLRKYNIEKKKKLIEENKQKKEHQQKIKLEAKNKLLQIKAEVTESKKLLLEAKNQERALKGLPALKRLPIIKKKPENVIIQDQQIGTYVPDSEENINTIETQNNDNDNDNNDKFCKAILKTGINKGKPCGCKSIIADTGLCSRHSKKDKTKDDINKDDINKDDIK